MFRSLLFAVAIGLSAGVIAGSIRSVLLRGKRQGGYNYSDPTVQKIASFNGCMLRFFKRAIYVLLALGIVWTLYYMVLGLADSAATEYAANASTLIVSVLTLFSIVLAYHEFMQRGQQEAPRQEDAPAGEDAKADAMCKDGEDPR